MKRVYFGFLSTSAFLACVLLGDLTANYEGLRWGMSRLIGILICLLGVGTVASVAAMKGGKGIYYTHGDFVMSLAIPGCAAAVLLVGLLVGMI